MQLNIIYNCLSGGLIISVAGAIAIADHGHPGFAICNEPDFKGDPRGISRTIDILSPLVL